LITVFFCKCIN